MNLKIVLLKNKSKLCNFFQYKWCKLNKFIQKKSEKDPKFKKIIDNLDTLGYEICFLIILILIF